MNKKPKYNTLKIVQTARQEGFKDFLKDFKTTEEAVSAAVLHLSLKYIQRKGISFRKSQFFRELASEIKLEGLKYIPKTWANLRNRIEAYSYGKPLTDLVYAKNKGNKNASILAKDDGSLKQLLLDFGASKENNSHASIYRKVREVQTACNRKTPSLRWVSNFLKDPKIQMITHVRFGSNSRHNAKWRPYTPAQKARFAGDCWELDGTRINLIDHKVKGEKGGKSLYIVAVRDVHSGVPVGWEYCHEESAQTIINALAMAVRNAGYLPYELRYDRFPGHNTAEWAFVEYELRSRGVKMTMTSKPEGKGHIERGWGTMQSVFMSESPYYYGEGIRSTRSHAHRSKEYINKMSKKAAKQGFDFDSACRESDRILNNYIHSPLSMYSRKYASLDVSPAELHEKSQKPNVKHINKQDFCYLFGLRKHLQLRNYMIQTEIHKAPYYYGVDDFDIAESYTGVQLTCCFDYEDLDNVHLFNNRAYLGTFSRIVEAQQYGPDKDMRAVGKVAHIKQVMNENRKRKLQESKAVVFHEENELSPELGALLAGHVSKAVYEASESAFLRKEWEEENADVNVAAVNMY